MKFEIPFATPSNNAVMRMHHRDRTRHHQDYQLQVRAETGAEKPRYSRCLVTVIRYGSRFLDWDNMGGGLKFLLDAMVKNNIIADDNPNCVLSLQLRQEKCKRADEKTVVVISEAA